MNTIEVTQLQAPIVEVTEQLTRVVEVFTPNASDVIGNLAYLSTSDDIDWTGVHTFVKATVEDFAALTAVIDSLTVVNLKFPAMGQGLLQTDANGTVFSSGNIYLPVNFFADVHFFGNLFADAANITGLKWENLINIPEQLTELLALNTDGYAKREGGHWVMGPMQTLDWGDIANKPVWHPVAYSGMYHDLEQIPVFAAVATSGWYYDLLDRPVFHTVAFSGEYSHLNNLPTFHAVAYSGDYNQLFNKPALSPLAGTGHWNDIVGKPTWHPVAYSGDYNDLSNLPVLGPLSSMFPTGTPAGNHFLRANASWARAMQPGDNLSEMNNDLNWITMIQAEGLMNTRQIAHMNLTYYSALALQDFGVRLAERADALATRQYLHVLGTIQPGVGISIDNTNPDSPIINSTGSGITVDWSQITNIPAFAPVAVAGTLVSLTDVSIIAPLDGQSVSWDNAAGKFVLQPKVASVMNGFGITVDALSAMAPIVGVDQAMVPNWTGAHTFTSFVDLHGPLKATGVEGNEGMVLTSGGVGVAPIWRTASGGSIQLSWSFSTSVGANNPGQKNLGLNSVVYDEVTIVSFNSVALGNIQASSILSLLMAGNRIYLQQQNSVDKAVVFEVIGPSVDMTGYWNVPVKNVKNTGLIFDNGADIAAVFIMSASGAGGADPTALIGLTAIPGTAFSFMRSDAAPALSQAIVPIWTGIHSYKSFTRFFSAATEIGNIGNQTGLFANPSADQFGIGSKTGEFGLGAGGRKYIAISATGNVALYGTINNTYSLTVYASWEKLAEFQGFWANDPVEVLVNNTHSATTTTAQYRLKANAQSAYIRLNSNLNPTIRELLFGSADPIAYRFANGANVTRLNIAADGKTTVYNDFRVQGLFTVTDMVNFTATLSAADGDTGFQLRTAGNLIQLGSATKAMTIDSQGRIVLHRPASGNSLAITTGSGSSNIIMGADLAEDAFRICYDLAFGPAWSIYSETEHMRIGTLGAADLALYSNNLARIVLDATGNVVLYGPLGLNGTNYGTAGQVLTSGGPGMIPTWTTVAGGGGGVDLAANYAWTGGHAFGGPYVVLPPYTLHNNPANALNEKRTVVNIQGPTFQIYNEDDAVTATRRILKADRSGVSLTSIEYGNPTDFAPHTFHGQIIGKSAAGRSLTLNSTNANGPYVTMERGAVAFADFGSEANIISGGVIDAFSMGTRGANALSLVVNTGGGVHKMWRASGNAGAVEYGNPTDNPAHIFYIDSAKQFSIKAPVGAYANLEICGNGNIPGTSGFVFGQSNDNSAVLYNRADAQMKFATNSTYRMVIAAAGQISVTSPDTPAIPSFATYESGTTDAHRGRHAVINAAADRAIYIGVYGVKSLLGSHNAALNAWAPLYINTVDASTGGTVYLPGETYVNGTRVLSYAASADSATNSVNANNATNSTWAYNWWSQSHPGTYYQVVNWDGTYWSVTSNHGSPIRVGFANSASNADMTDGYHVNPGVAPSTIIARDGNQYSFHYYINSSSPDNENSPLSQVWTSNGTDGFLRKASLQHLINSIGVAQYQSSLSPNSPGYMVFTNGARFMWGSFTGNGNGYTTVYFPTAFNIAPGVSVSAAGISNTAQDNTPGITSVTASYFQQFSALDNATFTSWTAVGY